MRKRIITLMMALAMCLSFSISSFAEEPDVTSVQTDSDAAVSASAQTGTFPVFRLYNKKTKEHLWTRSEKEYDINAAYHGWTKEGIAWRSANSGTPVYRLYNKKSGDHHYTKDTHEISVLVKKYGWKKEGVVFYSNGKIPVYRQYNRKFTRGAHHFTADKNEYIVSTTRNGWRKEGIAFYVAKTGGTRYNYSAHFFNQPYSDTPVGVFIKTNNPDPDSFSIEFLNAKGESPGYGISGTHDYLDLPLSAEQEKYTRYRFPYTVDGGYVHTCSINQPGEITVIIREYPGGNYVSTARAVMGKVTVRDNSAEYEAWKQSVIDAATTDDMTKKEKMTAIRDYLLAHTRYLKNYTDKQNQKRMLEFVVDSGIPEWVLGEWNSFTSPALLVELGDMIDYPLHNMYYDYPAGSADWKRYHSKAKSIEDGTMYSFCNISETNYYFDIHSRDDVEKVNCLTYENYYNCH